MALKTDIFNGGSPEFYINMKPSDIPREVGSEAWFSFWSEEKKKIENGFNLGGIRIPGGLYHHLNFYWMEVDDLSRPGKKKPARPTLRDNEWVIFNDYDYCEINSLIYTIFGLRQSGKSESMVSLCQRELGVQWHTEALSAFPKDAYRQTFTKKLEFSIKEGRKDNETNPFIPLNIDKDWTKDRVRFGVAKTDSEAIIKSTLFAYNTRMGIDTQILSGKSGTYFAMDEIATSKFLDVWNTVKPAMLGDSGKLRGAPFFAFTGGEADQAQDAKIWVEEPDENLKFVTELEDGRKIAGRFLDGTYRRDFKEVQTMSEYLGVVTDTYLDKMPIRVRDKEKALKVIEKEREDAGKSADKGAIIKSRTFTPLTIEDVFLVDKANDFNIAHIDAQQNYLKENNGDLKYVDLFRGITGKVEWSFSKKRPVNKFPVRAADDKDAPVCIWELPIDSAPRYTYCIGIDPYTHNESADKIVSLGSITVYKRMLNPLDQYGNDIVATYAGRPDDIEDFHELSIMMAEFYNAEWCVLYEASESSLRQHFKLKNKERFLTPSLELTKRVHQLTKIGGKYGLMPTLPNQNHYMGIMVKKMKGESYMLQTGDEEFDVSGIFRIKDSMLLEEMKQYRKGTGYQCHGINVDRIISFGCALTLAEYLDIEFGSLVQQRYKPEVEITEERKSVSRMFGSSSYNRNRVGGSGRMFGGR